MDQELENKPQSYSEENSREGYTPSSGSNYSRD